MILELSGERLSLIDMKKQKAVGFPTAFFMSCVGISVELCLDRRLHSIVLLELWEQFADIVRDGNGPVVA